MCVNCFTPLAEDDQFILIRYERCFTASPLEFLDKNESQGTNAKCNSSSQTISQHGRMCEIIVDFHSPVGVVLELDQ